MFFEDFVPGRVFELGSRTLSESDIVSFATEWDPQPLHLDGAVIASGWQTVCVWMRMYVDTVLNHAAMLAAPGVDEVRWLRPVTPGMRLNGRTTIIESWPSQRSPERGNVRLRGELLDDDGAVVMSVVGLGRVRRQDSAAVAEPDRRGAGGDR
jgi:acyl dehydratase